MPGKRKCCETGEETREVFIFPQKIDTADETCISPAEWKLNVHYFLLFSEVLSVQIYHLVFHTLCKFCRWETRALGIKSAMGPVTSIAVYKDATELLEVSEEVTCATCYETFEKEKIRKKHEMFHHGGVKITLNVV